ncbi:VWA domain-containing protein, partial [bacterium]|nr:VWA domain-containing protein [bacterium]
MNKMLNLTLLAVLLALFSCTDSEEVKGVSVDSYNDLVKKHNDLLRTKNSIRNGAWMASNSYADYISATQDMNIELEEFSSNVLEYFRLDDSDKRANYQSLKYSFERSNRTIIKAQSVLIEQYNELRELAPKVYNNSSYFSNLRSYKARGLSLSGILAEHQALWTLVTTSYKKAGGKASKQIELEQHEEHIAQADSSQGAGLGISDSGEIVVFTPEEFKQEASDRGFSNVVIEDTQTIAKQMNGVAGMACSDDDLVNVMNNLVSHMKSKANANSDDLEIVLVVDYSGSMDNNIKTVINHLQKFVQSLRNVINSGRQVRVGIVTFGNAGQEKIDLDLTSNFSSIQSTLTKLLDHYAQNNHSTNPGEASYYGLDKSAELSWRSKNRQVIVITDEESYSLQNGNQAYVNKVVQKMRAFNV